MKKNKGAALLLVIVTLAVMFTLGTALLTVSVSDTKQVAYQEDKIKAFYSARAGAEAMASFLIKNPDKALEAIGKTFSNPATGTIDAGAFRFEVVVTGDIDPVTKVIRKPIISSKSFKMINGTKSQTSAEIKLLMAEGNIFDHSVFSGQSPIIGNNNYVNGDVGTNGIIANQTIHNLINGDVTLGINATASDIEYAKSIVTDEHKDNVSKMISPIIFPPIDESKFTSSWLGDIDFTNNSDEPVYYDAKDVNIFDGSGQIRGNGEIHVLLHNSDIGDISKPEPGDTVRLYLYYAGTADVTINGNFYDSCAIYAPNAKVIYKGGGARNGYFTGSIICRYYEGPSSGTSFYSDPLLNMSHLMVTGVTGYSRVQYSK